MRTRITFARAELAAVVGLALLCALFWMLGIIKGLSDLRVAVPLGVIGIGAVCLFGLGAVIVIPVWALIARLRGSRLASAATSSAEPAELTPTWRHGLGFIAVLSLALALTFGLSGSSRWFGWSWADELFNSKPRPPRTTIQCGSAWQPRPDGEILSAYPAVQRSEAGKFSQDTPDDVLALCHQATSAGRTATIRLLAVSAVAAASWGYLHRRRQRRVAALVLAPPAEPPSDRASVADADPQLLGTT